MFFYVNPSLAFYQRFPVIPNDEKQLYNRNPLGIDVDSLLERTKFVNRMLSSVSKVFPFVYLVKGKLALNKVYLRIKMLDLLLFLVFDNISAKQLNVFDLMGF